MTNLQETTLNKKFTESEVNKENKFSHPRYFDFTCIILIFMSV